MLHLNLTEHKRFFLSILIVMCVMCLGTAMANCGLYNFYEPIACYHFVHCHNLVHCQCLFSITSWIAQSRAPFSPLQTTWTGFDPNIAVGDPQQARSGGSSNCKVFYMLFPPEHGLLRMTHHNINKDM